VQRHKASDERKTRRYHGVYILTYTHVFAAKAARARVKSVSANRPTIVIRGFYPFHGNAKYMANEEVIDLVKTIQHKTSNDRRFSSHSLESTLCLIPFLYLKFNNGK